MGGGEHSTRTDSQGHINRLLTSCDRKCLACVYSTFSIIDACANDMQPHIGVGLVLWFCYLIATVNRGYSIPRLAHPIC
jgi:hypothetical protein